MAAKHRLLAIRLVSAVAIAGSTLSLSGCHNFFICEKASCPSSGSGSGSGDYAYVANSASGSTYLNGYEISSGTLSVISGFPANLGITPVALAITPNNSYLYVASTSSVYEYSIGTSGGLTLDNSGKAVVAPLTGVSSMDVSPDGNYLFVLDSIGTVLYEYPITSSSGLLGTGTSLTVSATPLTFITAPSVRVSPNENFVVCALGTAGDLVFPYSSASGITNPTPASISTGSATVGDYAVAMDTSNYMYLARTNAPAVYSVSVPTSTTVSVTSVTQSSSLTSGAGPHSIVLNSNSGGYAYIGNFTDGTISAYSSASGVLTALAGTTTAPTNVSALARDNSGKYILALGYNASSGIQLYTIGSSGTLTSSASAGSGTSTSIPAVMALTH